MNPDHRKLFDELEPPPGGTEQFRRRLERLEPREPFVNGKLIVAGALAALLTVVVLGIVNLPDRSGVGSTPPETLAGDGNVADDEARAAALAEAPQFARLLGRPIPDADLRVAVNEQLVSVTEVSSTNPKIRIYEIERD